MTESIEYVRKMSGPAHTAMLMWDFQVGLAGKASRLPELVTAAQRLLHAADDAGVPVIWSRHTLAAPKELPPGMQYFMMRKQGVTDVEEMRAFMQLGSREREFLAEMQPRPHDVVIEKSTPSFFVGTTLQQRLFALGTRSVAFAGVATEIGVDLSAKHALALGYLPIVVSDATGSYTDERQELGLAALDSWIPVVTSKQLTAHWRA